MTEPTMIAPDSVLVLIPSLDGTMECGTAGGLMSSAAAHYFGNVTYKLHCSHVGLVRDLLVDQFLKLEQFQWAVFIDADIIFTAQDFAYLMDYPKRGEEYKGEENPEGTTLTADGHAAIVTAEYSRKIDSLARVRFGLGFTRIHRSVFQTMMDAKMEDDTPRVGQFRNDGGFVWEFFPSGPGMDGQWFGEDTGFFHTVRVCGITPRVETRTRLIHAGKKFYPYVPG